MEAPGTAPSILLIPIDELQPAEDNFRGPVSDEDVAELTELVKAQGILEPLTVCPKEGGVYKLVFGHRRLRAAQLAGLTHVPAQVKPYEDAERLAVMLAENLGRKDLSALQEARAFQHMLTLKDATGRPRFTTRTLASALGVGQSKVSNYTSIFKLPEDIIAALEAGGITMTQAIQLTRIAKYPDRVRAAVSSWRSYGDMGNAVQRQQDEIDREQARAKKLKELRAAGVRIAPDDWLGQGGRRIGPGYTVPIEPEEHAAEPCHAAAVSPGGEVFYVCMEPERHRPAAAPPPEPEATGEDQAPTPGRLGLSVVPTPPEKTPEEEAAEAARREEEAARRAEEEARQAAAQARLEALQTAAEARTVALRTLLAGRQGKGEVTRRFLNWFLLRLLDESSEDEFVRQVLSVEQPPDAEAEQAWQLLEYAATNKDSLQRAAVAVACGMAEQQLEGEYPNFGNPHVQLYYDYLTQTGVYELSDVERAELLAAGVELPEPAKEEVTA